MTKPDGPEQKSAVGDMVERFKGPQVADGKVFNTNQGLSRDCVEHHSADPGRGTNSGQDRSPSCP